MAFPILMKLGFSAPGVEEGMGRIKNEFSSLQQTGQRAGQGFKNMSVGLTGMAIAAAPVAAGVGLATNTFADFEKQMSVVKSLTGSVTDQEFKAMEAEAKRLGATTSFSAKEAAEGLQYLALAGFSAKDQTESLEGVLNLAAAGSITLAQASDIATDSLSAMAPAFDQTKGKAENLALLNDKMAWIQSKTNTNILQLGEAIKFGGGAMAAAKIPLNEILASMGALANAGLKGSIGGTALTNMFDKLADPSQKATDLMEKYNISVKDSKGNFKSLPSLVKEFNKAFDNLPGGVDKAAVATELFGVRGKRAFFALQNEGAASLTKMIEGVGNATGTASAQAKERLNNLAGSFTILKSATEGILIEVGALFGKSMTGPIKGVADAIGGITLAFQFLNSEGEDGEKIWANLVQTFGEEGAASVVSFVGGFVDGFKEAKENIIATITYAKALFTEIFGGSDEANNTIGRTLGKIMTYGAILAPIFAAIVGAMFIIPPIITGITGLFGVLGAVVSAPFLLAVGAIAIVAAVFYKFKDQIMDFIRVILSKLVPVWEVLKTSAMYVFGVVSEVFTKLVDSLGSAFEPIQQAFTNIFGAGDEGATSFADTLISIIQFVTPLVVGAVQSIGDIISWVFQSSGKIIGAAIDLMGSGFAFIKALIFGTPEQASEAFGRLGESIGNAFDTILSVVGNLIDTGFKVFGTMFNSLFEAMGLKAETMGDFFLGIWNNIVATIGNAGGFFTEIFGGIINGVKNLFETSLNGLINLIATLGEKITSTVTNPIDTIKGFFGFGEGQEVSKLNLNKTVENVKLADTATNSATAANAARSGIEQTALVAPSSSQQISREPFGSGFDNFKFLPTIQTTVEIDGQAIAIAQAKTQTELLERSGENISGSLRQKLERGKIINNVEGE